MKENKENHNKLTLAFYYIQKSFSTFFLHYISQQFVCSCENVYVLL